MTILTYEIKINSWLSSYISLFSTSITPKLQNSTHVVINLLTYIIDSHFLPC